MPLDRRSLVLAALSALGLACTSTRVLQRDGCWVKRTERTLGGSSEELGFCGKPQPVWAQDRLARLTQECIAQADHRWENRALAAWSHGQPIPAPDADGQTAKNCITEAARALGVEAENAALKARLDEVAQDREALRVRLEATQKFLQGSNDKLADALGEAAKKPPPSAFATANSTGTGSAKSEPNAAPPTVVGINGAPPVVVNQAAATPAVVNPPEPVAPILVKPEVAPIPVAPPVRSQPVCPPGTRKKGRSKEAPLCTTANDGR